MTRLEDGRLSSGRRKGQRQQLLAGIVDRSTTTGWVIPSGPWRRAIHRGREAGRTDKTYHPLGVFGKASTTPTSLKGSSTAENLGARLSASIEKQVPVKVSRVVEARDDEFHTV